MQKLSIATSEGDVSALYRVISNNPDLLECIDQKPFNHTPLHIAAETAHTHFALEIMSLKPSLGRGRERITPLHYAAEVEEIDFLAEFLRKCPASIEDVTLCCETAEHIAMKNGKLRAFKVLFGWLKRTNRKEILNWGDEDGNTVLHVTASTNQTEVAKLLVKYVNVNAKNHEGLTALDISNTKPPIQVNARMKKILLRAGASKASRLHQLPTLAEMLGSPEALIEKIFQINAYLDEGLSGEMCNSMLVAAILIATSAYQSVLSPPAPWPPQINQRWSLEKW
ncbi:ankyrin repeat-containing protein BDA1-like [Coffea arabica]|uniref:Ankyrin repeat-containing protein BDA1-like n=1 Tax=Coffea arabica TaxID=13443 RepID=A0A6P6X5I7_COFAR|nr:ankyrin repeat-containing protein BDA1-like [Coffea arabica]